VRFRPSSGPRNGRPVRCFRGSSWLVARNDSDSEIGSTSTACSRCRKARREPLSSRARTVLDDAELTVEHARDSPLLSAADEVD